MLEPELAPTPPPEPKPPAEESWSRETALSAVQLGGDTKRGVTPRQLKRRMKDEEQRRRRATRARCGAPWPIDSILPHRTARNILDSSMVASGTGF